MITVSEIKQTEMGTIFPYIERLLDDHESYSKGAFTKASCLEAFWSGQHKLFMALDDEEAEVVGLSCVIDDLDGSRRPFTLIIWTQGAMHRLEDWGPLMLAYLEDRAAKLGHNRVVNVGRKGWARTILSDYRILGYVYEKVIA